MLGGICWCSASPTLPQGCLHWLSPLVPSRAGSPGAVEEQHCAPVSPPSPRLMQLVWSRCLCPKRCFGTNAVQNWCGQQEHNWLSSAPPPDLLPWLLGGSPGSILTVTTAFISCSLGKWCKGKHFLHSLRITHQGSCWISFLVLRFWCMQPLQYYALFSTLSLQNGRCKNFSHVDLLWSNHRLTVWDLCGGIPEIRFIRLSHLLWNMY